MYPKKRRVFVSFLFLLLLALCIGGPPVQAAKNKKGTIHKIKYKGDATKEIFLFKGESYQIPLILTPSSGKRSQLIWKTSNGGIVSVGPKGTARGRKPGTATVSVSIKNQARSRIQLRFRVIAKNKPLDVTRSVAHRGITRYSSQNCIENTLTAFKNAANTSFDYVEMDVRLSRDKKFMVIHDKTLTRIADLPIPVSALTAGELTALPLYLSNNSQPFSPDSITVEEYDEEYEGEYYEYQWDDTDNTGFPDANAIPASDHIPLLREALATTSRYGLGVNVELKELLSKEQLTSLLKIIKKYYPQDNVIISSSYKRNLRRLASMKTYKATKYKLQFIAPAPSQSVLNFCSKFGIHLSLPKHNFTSSTVNTLHRFGLTLSVGRVQGKQQAAKFRKMGVDFIASDSIL